MLHDSNALYDRRFPSKTDMRLLQPVFLAIQAFHRSVVRRVGALESTADYEA